MHLHQRAIALEMEDGQGQILEKDVYRVAVWSVFSDFIFHSLNDILSPETSLGARYSLYVVQDS